MRKMLLALPGIATLALFGAINPLPPRQVGHRLLPD